MTSIFEVLNLERDYASAKAALRALVESARRGGWYSTLQLRAEIGPATLRKAVIVTFESGEERFDELWPIRWTPENGGPFPTFQGLLGVQSASDGGAQLEIRGEYVPPFGPIGQGFDLAVGQLIASRTCRNLLRDIAAQIELHSIV